MLRHPHDSRHVRTISSSSALSGKMPPTSDRHKLACPIYYRLSRFRWPLNLLPYSCLSTVCGSLAADCPLVLSLCYHTALIRRAMHTFPYTLGVPRLSGFPVNSRGTKHRVSTSCDTVCSYTTFRSRYYNTFITVKHRCPYMTQLMYRPVEQSHDVRGPPGSPQEIRPYLYPITRYRMT